MGLQQEAQTIFKLTEKLQYSQALPAKQAIMFADGVQYQTGSDYTAEQLREKIGDLESIDKCNSCEGTGELYYASGEDDYSTELCENCGGHGFIGVGKDVIEMFDLRTNMGLPKY